VKIYDLNKGDLFTFDGAVAPLRYHGMDGMYARCSIASEGFKDVYAAFAAKRVAYIGCAAEVEKLETSEERGAT